MTTHDAKLTPKELPTERPARPVQVNSRPSASRPAPASDVEAMFNPRAVLHALRRRWLAALAIAVPATLLVAAACWFVIPARYTAFALLRMAANEPRLVFDTAESKADFNTYRQTQTALITSRFVLNAALRKPGVGDSRTLSQQAYPLAWLESELDIGTQRSPEILRIAMTGEHPVELAAIVNAVKDAYLEEVVHAERRDRLTRLADLERIFQETDEKARHKQERVDKLAKQLGTGDSRALTLKQQMALEYFSQLQREYSRIRFELMREQLEASAPSTPPGAFADATSRTDSASASSDSMAPLSPGLASLARRAAQLRALIARYEKQVVDQQHPALVEHRRQLERLEAEIEEAQEPYDFEPSVAGTASPERRVPRNRPMSRREVLQRQEQLLREEVDKYSVLVDTIGTSSFELEAMQTELGQVTKVADRIGQEIEALRIELQSPPRVAPLQSAEVPQTRDLGKKKKLTGMAGLGTFGGIVGLILLLDLRRRTVSVPGEITAETGLRVLGSLPEPSARGRHAAMSVDSIRSLLLRFLEGEGNRRVLMVAPIAGEDPARNTIDALAHSLANAGRNTLLVDLDLAQPAVHQPLRMDNSIGVADVLRGEIDWKTAASQRADTSLFVLPAGQGTQDALSALSRGDARSMLAEMKTEFDVVLVNAPPLLCGADAAAIAHDVDAAILLVRRDESQMPRIVAARDQLAALGIPVVGVLFLGMHDPSQIERASDSPTRPTTRSFAGTTA